MASTFRVNPPVICAAVAGAGKSAVIAGCVVVAMSACSHPGAPVKTSTAPASGIDAGSLIVSVDDARRITHYDALTPQTQSDLHQPSQGNVNAPGPCRAVGSTDLTFGSGWTQFRRAAYNGATDVLEPGGEAMIDEVSQAVAVYPDTGTARGALDRLESTLTECAALHDTAYDFVLDKPDPATLRLGSPGWSHQYRVKSSVLISVGVLGIEPEQQFATTILQTISDRIK